MTAKTEPCDCDERQFSGVKVASGTEPRQLGLLAPTEAELRAEETDTAATSDGDERGRSIDLRCGRWQDVLAGVECDALICDPPYGGRTHAAHAARASDRGGHRRDGGKFSDIGYTPWTPEDVEEFVSGWRGRVRCWWACMTSHDLLPAWTENFERAGLYPFAPLPVIDRGSRVRLQGDGPSGWTVWMVVARPRTKAMAKWGALPGLYERSPGDQRSGRMGGKPLGVMRAIVRDYSRPGDIVCDPFAGRATTLLAAAIELRVAIGSEADPEEHTLAMARLANGYTPDMFARALPGSEVDAVSTVHARRAQGAGWAP